MHCALLPSPPPAARPAAVPAPGPAGLGQRPPAPVRGVGNTPSIAAAHGSSDASAIRLFVLGLARDARTATPPAALARAVQDHAPLISYVDALLTALGAEGHSLLERRVLTRPPWRSVVETFERFSSVRAQRSRSRSVARQDARLPSFCCAWPPRGAWTLADAGAPALPVRIRNLPRVSAVALACTALPWLLAHPVEGHVSHAPMSPRGAWADPSTAAPPTSLPGYCQVIVPSQSALQTLETTIPAVCHWDAIQRLPQAELAPLSACLTRLQRELRDITARLAAKRWRLADSASVLSPEAEMELEILTATVERVRDLSTRVFDARLQVRARRGDAAV